jgi:hypothetical protein
MGREIPSAVQCQRLTCQRLILTHMSQDMLGHIDEVEFECSADGRIIVV